MNTTKMGSFQTPMGTRSATLLDTSCGYLLQELQMIWDEVGEDQFEREKVLLDLEQECLEVYRRKVDSASISRGRLHQELAESEAEFTHLLLSLGERSLPGRPEKMAGTLKEQLDSISPALQEMQLRKDERVKQFQDVLRQIQEISAEIAGQSESSSSETKILVNENDLSLKKLEEYQIELQRLRNEKNDRLQRVEKYLSTVQSLSSILGMDSSMIITKVHPSLSNVSGLSKNISEGILAKLNSTVESLEDEKLTRLSKLHHLGKSLTDLWSLMGTSFEERQLFSHITSLLSVSSAEISAPDSLTLDIIQQADAEVKRLDQLKASKMKELFFKKQFELETICSRSHMGIPSRSEMENIINLVHSGEIDHSDLLMSLDDQIARAKDEAHSRQVIMEKVAKWMLAREEERWLEDYSRDENRYSVSRGAHKNLRRAERARVMVNRIPALVESLIEKTREWEGERNKVFLYDEVSLLAMLEDYYVLRHEKEEENRRQRDKKKVQSQIVTQARPSTSSRRISDRSINGGFVSDNSQNRRVSLGMNNIKSASQGTSFIREGQKASGQKKFVQPAIGSHVKDDTASVVSTYSGPLSP